MFEEASEHGTYGDVLAQAVDARAQSADSADEDFDGDPGLGCPVEGVDDGFVDDRVDLDPHLPRSAGLCDRDLGVDEVDEPGAHSAGSDEEP